VIEIDDLTLGYPALDILREINLSVEKGGFFGIIGPNGSGKTTLLKGLGRILLPSAGTITIEGRELSEYSFRDLAKEMGVVPQETNISFDFTVRDIVMMGRHPYIKRFSSESVKDVEIARHAMEVTNTLAFADRSVNEVSGGERQRVIIARALAQQPRILLLDEATSHLDISHQIEILNIMKNLKGEVTIVGVFHDLNLASYYCDRMVMIDEGRIAAIGTPNEVLTRENLKKTFSIDSVIRTNPMTGRPYVIPIINSGRQVHEKQRVHIICGGGSGSDLIYSLSDLGYQITAGVLGINDTDYLTAQNLGIPCVSEAPFTAVGDESLYKLKACIKEADIVVVTGMPVGPGNIANLRVLEDIGDTPVRVYQQAGENICAQDFTGGEAGRIISGLVESGAKVLNSQEELIGDLREI